VHMKIIKIIIAIVSAALLYFSCTSDVTPFDPNNPTITVVPDGMPGNWADCSGKLGTHACNFVLKDQHNKDWQLYEHHGEIIVLDFSAMWCGVCMGAALEVQHFQEIYGPEKVVWVTVLLQDFFGQLPAVAHLNEWAKVFDIESAPVLAADENIYDMILNGEGYVINVLPTIVIIDREMTNVYYLEGWNKNRILDQIDKLLK